MFEENAHVPFSVVDSSIPSSNPATLGLISLSGTTVVDLTVWDLNQHTVNLGTGESTQLSISTAISLAQALVGASLSLPDNVAGGEIRVVSGAGIAVNLNGTPDGSVGAGGGFAVSTDAPSATSPDVFLPGQVFKFGRFDGQQVLGSALRIANVYKSFAGQSITAGTAVAIWTPATGKKFVLMGYNLSTSAAGRIILKDGSSVMLNTPDLPAAGKDSNGLGAGIQSSTANNLLNVDVSASGTVSGYVYGIEE